MKLEKVVRREWLFLLGNSGIIKRLEVPGRYVELVGLDMVKNREKKGAAALPETLKNVFYGWI